MASTRPERPFKEPEVLTRRPALRSPEQDKAIRASQANLVTPAAPPQLVTCPTCGLKSFALEERSSVQVAT